MGLERRAGVLSRRLAERHRLEPLKLVVQGDVDHDRWQLHTEQVDARSDDREQAIDSRERPQAHERGDDHCQPRADPDEDKQRLVVLDDSIDHLKCSDEADVIQALDAGHHDDREGEQEPADERAQTRCDKQHQPEENQEHLPL
jgi:hypothetical protein